MTLSISLYTYWPFVYLLSIFISFPILLGILRVKESLYFLVARPLTDIWFSNIFSHSAGFLFTFLNVLFALQILKIWWNPVYLFSLLLLIVLVLYLRNHCLTQGHEDLLLCFILSFIVLLLTFKAYDSFWVNSFFICKLIYLFLFLAALGLCCCSRAFL